jgi:lipid-binding SYLF domain-containing protein
MHHSSLSYFRYALLALLLTLMGTLASSLAQAKQPKIQDYSSTIAVFKKSPEGQAYFNHAYGFAVFPTVGKGGFGIGAAHGKGQVYVGNKVTGFTTINQLSIGFQVGGQAFSQIIFFEDERAYKEFTSGNFEFDATASAVAITAGAQAQASTTGSSAGASAGPATGKQIASNYNKGMATLIHAKGGLMYQAAIGGQKFTYESL